MLSSCFIIHAKGYMREKKFSIYTDILANRLLYHGKFLVLVKIYPLAMKTQYTGNSNNKIIKSTWTICLLHEHERFTSFSKVTNPSSNTTDNLILIMMLSYNIDNKNKLKIYSEFLVYHECKGRKYYYNK